MILVFGNNKHWISKTIRVRTGSIWSHVGIVYEVDGQYFVVEACGGVGVHSIPLEVFQKRYKQVTFREVAGDVNLALEHIGAPFDIKGIKGILWRNWKHCPDSWFCSELVAWAIPHIPNEFAHYYTPAGIFRLSFQLDLERYMFYVRYIEERNGNTVEFIRKPNPFALEQ
jgi:hypothetical protein